MGKIDIAKARARFPEYGHLTDAQLEASIIAKYPQYGGEPISGSLTRPVPNGFILGNIEKSRSIRIADTLDARARAAQALLTMQRSIMASTLGVSLEAYDVMQTAANNTNLAILFEEAKSRIATSQSAREADIALEKVRAFNVQARTTLVDAKRDLFAAYDERAELQKNDDPEKDAKLAILNVSIEALEAEHGRLSQALIPEGHGPRLGPVRQPDPKDSGREDKDSEEGLE